MVATTSAGRITFRKVFDRKLVRDMRFFNLVDSRENPLWKHSPIEESSQQWYGGEIQTMATDERLDQLAEHYRRIESGELSEDSPFPTLDINRHIKPRTR